MGALVVAEASAQTSAEFTVSFRQGESWLDLSYRDNRASVSQFIEDVKSLSMSPDKIVFSVNMKTTVSPDGNTALNEKIASERTKSVREYLSAKTGLNVSQFKVTYSGIDWNHLDYMLKATDCPWIYEVREAVASADTDETKCAAIMNIEEGICWRWLLDNVFHEMRSVTGYAKVFSINGADRASVRDTLVMVHKYENKRDRESSDTVIVSHKDTVYAVAAVRRSQKPARSHYWKQDDEFRKPIVALRTNLLLPLLNAGIEVPFTNRFSASLNVYYPWVPRPLMNRLYSRNSVCVQAFASYLEASVWLGRCHRMEPKYDRYRLRGHSISVIGAGGYYDFQGFWNTPHLVNGVNVNENKSLGVQGEVYAVGVGYRYALPLGRGDIHLDFDVAVGVIFNNTHPYFVDAYKDDTAIRERDEMMNIIKTRRNIYWGYPLRAGVSLVVPISMERRASR